MTTVVNHRLVDIPKGKMVSDLLPQFVDIRQEIGPIGTPCPFCPSCAKLFRGARKPRRRLWLYATWLQAPIAIGYRLCGLCSKRYSAGGRERENVLANVERFLDGSEVSA